MYQWNVGYIVDRTIFLDLHIQGLGISFGSK